MGSLASIARLQGILWLFVCEDPMEVQKMCLLISSDRAEKKWW